MKNKNDDDATGRKGGGRSDWAFQRTGSLDKGVGRKLLMLITNNKSTLVLVGVCVNISESQRGGVGRPRGYIRYTHVLTPCERARSRQ